MRHAPLSFILAVTMMSLLGCGDNRQSSTSRVLFIESNPTTASKPAPIPPGLITEEVHLELQTFTRLPQNLLDAGLLCLDGQPVFIPTRVLETILEHPRDLIATNLELTTFAGQEGNTAFVRQFAYIEGYNQDTSIPEPNIAVLDYGNVVHAQCTPTTQGVNINHLASNQVVLHDMKQVTIEHPKGTLPIEQPLVTTGAIQWPASGKELPVDHTIVVPFRYTSPTGVTQSVLALSARVSTLARPVRSEDVKNFPAVKLGKTQPQAVFHSSLSHKD